MAGGVIVDDLELLFQFVSTRVVAVFEISGVIQEGLGHVFSHWTLGGINVAMRMLTPYIDVIVFVDGFQWFSPRRIAEARTNRIFIPSA